MIVERGSIYRRDNFREVFQNDEALVSIHPLLLLSYTVYSNRCIFVNTRCQEGEQRMGSK